jgi:hypothetical protein
MNVAMGGGDEIEVSINECRFDRHMHLTVKMPLLLVVITAEFM